MASARIDARVPEIWRVGIAKKLAAHVEPMSEADIAVAEAFSRV